MRHTVRATIKQPTSTPPRQPAGPAIQPPPDVPHEPFVAYDEPAPLVGGPTEDDSKRRVVPFMAILIADFRFLSLAERWPGCIYRARHSRRVALCNRRRRRRRPRRSPHRPPRRSCPSPQPPNATPAPIPAQTPRPAAPLPTPQAKIPTPQPRAPIPTPQPPAQAPPAVQAPAPAPDSSASDWLAPRDHSRGCPRAAEPGSASGTAATTRPGTGKATGASTRKNPRSAASSGPATRAKTG